MASTHELFIVGLVLVFMFCSSGRCQSYSQDLEFKGIPLGQGLRTEFSTPVMRSLSDTSDFQKEVDFTEPALRFPPGFPRTGIFNSLAYLTRMAIQAMPFPLFFLLYPLYKIIKAAEKIFG